MPLVRTPFNYDRRKASLASALVCTDETRAQQQFKDECDINEIVRRFGLGYDMPVGLKVPTYGDFSNLESYHDACNAIAEAHENFDLLPAHLRARFDNAPYKLMDFLSNDSNRDEAIKLGLVPAPIPVTPGPSAAGSTNNNNNVATATAAPAATP